MNLLKSGWIAVLAMVISLPGYTAAQDGGIYYQQALEQLRNQDYAAALQQLEQAEQAGIQSPSFHYNKGVALYKLQRYALAKQAFLNAGDTPLVHYNLGLVNYRLEDYPAARDYFQQVAQQAEEAPLRGMAGAMLEKLDQAAPRPAPRKPWRLITDLSLGYDDNVTLASSELAQETNQQDSFWDLYLSGSYLITGDRRDGLVLAASMVQTRYQTETQYNFAEYALQITGYHRLGDWDSRLQGKVANSTLGGNDYMQTWSGRYQLSRKLNGHQRLRAYYDLTFYSEQDPGYDYLGGLRHRAKLDSRWRFGDQRLKLGYTFEYNDRDDSYSRQQNSFTSYSATRHELEAGYQFPLANNWEGELTGDYRFSRYHDANIEAGVTQELREDVRFRIGGGVNYRLNKYIDLVASYLYIHNDSNHPTRSYQRSQWMVGLQGMF